MGARQSPAKKVIVKTRLVLGVGTLLLASLIPAPSAAAGKPSPRNETLKELIRLAEASLTGFELEEGELEELARELDRAPAAGPAAHADRQLAERAYRLSARELVKCADQLEKALAAGERQRALRLYEREFIPLCLDLAVCQAAASMGPIAGP